MPRPDTRQPLVYVVVLNWNNAPDTLSCLASLARLNYGNAVPLVVDNGSADDSVERIRANAPAVHLIETRTNLGYAEGNNVGIRYALALGADYVLVLNNDTLVAPSMVTHLVNVAESRRNIGMVGPLMYCTAPQSALFAAGSFIQWTRGQTWNRGMFEPAVRYDRLACAEPVDYIAGCGVLVSRRLVEAVGGLDSNYFLNYEDVEWAVRARRSGFEVWFVPYATLWHKVSASFGVASPANTYYMTRNALRFFWQNAPRPLRLLAVTRIIGRTLRTVAAWSLKPQYQTADFRRKRDANVLALRDFLLGRSGRMGADVEAVCYPGQ